MEKRLFLAIALSIVILVVYSQVSAKFFPQQAPEEQVQQAPKTQPSTTQPKADLPAAVPQMPPSYQPAQQEVKFEKVQLNTPEINLSLSSPGGSIVDITLNHYIDDKTKTATKLIEDQGPAWGISALSGSEYFNQALFRGSVSQTDGKLVYSFSENGKILKKAFSRLNNSYYSELEISLDNKSISNWFDSFEITAFTYKIIPRQMDNRFDQIIIENAEKALRFSPSRLKDGQILFSGPVKWVGLKHRYFSIITKPHFEVNSVKAYRQDDLVRVALVGNVNIPAGARLDQKLDLFTGPNSLNAMQHKELGIEKILDAGIISATLLYILRFLEGITHNWGLSIILLSALIYFIFLPLTAKSMSSMKKMQALAPKMEELRKAYKDNPQKMQKETMELYKKHGVNPFTGCLPMLFQLPIFFALYKTLMASVELKGAHFLWIKDLSLPDRLIMFPEPINLMFFKVESFNLLPLIMCAAMFFQQKLSMVSGGKSQQAEQQRMMSIMMPIIFGVIFYNFPSGLVLYWLTNTLLMLSYYYKIRHLHTVQE